MMGRRHGKGVGREEGEEVQKSIQGLGLVKPLEETTNCFSHAVVTRRQTVYCFKLIKTQQSKITQNRFLNN